MIEIKGYEYPEELIEWLRPGNKIRIYPKQLHRKEVLHILAIVDEDRLVTKSWWKYKQRWHYRVEWFYMFKLNYRDNNIELVK